MFVAGIPKLECVLNR